MFVFLTNFITVYSDDCLQKTCVKKKKKGLWWPLWKVLLISTWTGLRGWMLSIRDVHIEDVTAPARVHLAHDGNPDELLCTVRLPVAVETAQNLVFTSIWCKSWVPWSSESEFTWCLVWIWTHTPASCPICLNVTLKRSSSLRRSAAQMSIKDVFYWDVWP